RRQYHNRGGMRELLSFGIVLILKSNGFRERGNRVLLAGKKMPALLDSFAAVAGQILQLLLRRHFRRFAGIKAHSQNLELPARIELQTSECDSQPAQHFRAKHLAIEIGQIQDDRLLAEIISET